MEDFACECRRHILLAEVMHLVTNITIINLIKVEHYIHLLIVYVPLLYIREVK